MARQIQRLKELITAHTFPHVRNGRAGLQLQRLESELTVWFSGWGFGLTVRDVGEIDDNWTRGLESLAQGGYPLLSELDRVWRQTWYRHPRLLNMLFERSRSTCPEPPLDEEIEFDLEENK